MIDKSGSLKLVWAFSAGVSTIGPVPDHDASSREPGSGTAGSGTGPKRTKREAGRVRYWQYGKQKSRLT